MRVKALKRFKDLDAGLFRDEGEEFNVTPKRFEAINGTKYGALVEQVAGANDGESARPYDGGNEGNPQKRQQRRKTAKSE